MVARPGADWYEPENVEGQIAIRFLYVIVVQRLQCDVYGSGQGRAYSAAGHRFARRGRGMERYGEATRGVNHVGDHLHRIALAADVPKFSTHTTRHLCLTDLARMGWELHTIATFAGHRHTDSTLRYIHLSGRDLADKFGRSMDHIHAQRIAILATAGTPR